MNVNNLIYVLIFMVIGISLVGTVADAVTTANQSGAVGALLDIAPIVFVAIIVVGGLLYMRSK